MLNVQNQINKLAKEKRSHCTAKEYNFTGKIYFLGSESSNPFTKETVLFDGEAEKKVSNFL